MACVLTFQNGRFELPNGTTFTLDLNPPSGGVLSLLQMKYAGGSVITAPPYNFVAVAGEQFLHVIYDAPPPMAGQVFELIELCGGGAQNVLRPHHFDPANLGFSVLINGI